MLFSSVHFNGLTIERIKSTGLEFGTDLCRVINGTEEKLCRAPYSFEEGREGVKWELGLALFWTGKMGFYSLGLGFSHWEWDEQL